MGDDDWNLVTGTTITRTRGSGTRRLSTAVDLLDEDDSESIDELQSEELVENEDPEEEEEEAAATKQKKFIKPANHRVVLEVDQIDKVIGQLACRECGEAVKVTLRNVCIATSIGIECMNEERGFFYHPVPSRATCRYNDPSCYRRQLRKKH